VSGNSEPQFQGYEACLSTLKLRKLESKWKAEKIEDLI